MIRFLGTIKTQRFRFCSKDPLVTSPGIHSVHRSLDPWRETVHDSNTMLAETAAAAAVDADSAAAAVDKLASLSTAEKKRPRTTRQATDTQPVLFAADASLAAALEAVPADDWGRNWAPSRTMMLRRTSKRVKGAVDKLRLPAVVRVCGFDFSPAFE